MMMPFLTYDTSTLRESVEQHITALGAELADWSEQSDAVVLVLTRGASSTECSRYLAAWEENCRNGVPTIVIDASSATQYVPASENMPADAEIGVIPIDAIYTPIKNVKYEIENYRVEGKTDYERLVFDIETDGSINPTDALKEAAKILIHHFMLFSDEKITLETEDKYGNEEFDEEVLHMRQLLKTKLVDMDLSVRALNCLKSAEVETLGELVQFNKNDLLKFRNFGKKSLTELEALLENNNLEFGMDVAKYKLDKE